MVGHDIVVVGGSAGGVDALKRLAADLPGDLPAAVFIVLHLSPSARSFLPDVLGRNSKLPVAHAKDGETIEPGRIYVAPPDLHMLLRPGQVILRRGPQENWTRPAIDPLFRSAAVNYRSRVVGAILSGTLDDGAAGLTAIKLCGGITVVQDPADAMWAEMPRHALACDHVDHTVPLAAMPALLARLTREEPGPPRPVPQNLVLETKIAALETFMPADQPILGQPTPLSCPQCGGVLNEVTDEGSTRFRCQIGHAFSAEALIAAQHTELARALESAMRIHRDRMTLFRRMQSTSEGQGMRHAAARWRAAADESENAANLIAQALGIMKPSTE